MKVVHISTTDWGGAYIATERINEALNCVGVDSKVLVRTRSGNTNTTEIVSKPYQRLLSKTKNFANLMLSKGEVITDCFGTDLSKIADIRSADIIVLHWVNSFVSIRTVYKLAMLGKPLFWVMHDMWPFTGGCHIDGFCGGYESGCEICPLLKNNSLFNISRANSLIKKRLNKSVRILYVAISKWERDCASNSEIIVPNEVMLIPNPINTDIFCVKDKLSVRKKMNIVSKRKLLLFGADKISDNTNKGFNYLIEAINGLSDEYEAFCFGNIKDSDKIQLKNVKINYLGRLSQTELTDWYNAADVMIVPSIQETFCYTCCEALCCGTPVVAFETGGLIDQISHKKNGYLASLRDVEDLRRGIIWAAHEYEYDASVTEAFRTEHSYARIGNQYKELFSDFYDEKD